MGAAKLLSNLSPSHRLPPPELYVHPLSPWEGALLPHSPPPPSPSLHAFPALAQAGRPEVGHVKLTLSSSLLDARNEELATGHRVYLPIKAPAHAQRGGRAEHKGNVALRFKYFDGTRELPKGELPKPQHAPRQPQHGPRHLPRPQP